MFLFAFRAKVLPLAVAFLFSAPLLAAGSGSEAKPDAVGKKQTVVRKHKRFTPDELKIEKSRLDGIMKRTNNVFALFGGEMALQKGEAGTALATYMIMLERTKSPEVAERALEVAVSLGAFEQAEMIYQKWREIEPVPGEAQKRMTWLRNLLLGRADKDLSGLNQVLAQASEEQSKRIFLLLAQAAVQQKDLARKASGQVHKAASAYAELPEAAIADAVYSAQDGNKKHAIAALQRLARLDTEILPPTLLTLRLTAQRHPEILNGFFEQTDTRNLSTVWQELEIMNLVANRLHDKAYERLNVLLEANPDADLFIQAALLAEKRKDDISVMNGYLEKAYNSGTREQQSRAAITGAIAYGSEKNYPKARQWLAKITAPEYLFDKAVLSASIEAELGRGRLALKEARNARKLPEKQGRYFSGYDLQKVMLFALSKYDNQAEALAELNKMTVEGTEWEDSDLMADILYQRALVHERMGNLKKTEADFRKALSLAPDNADILNALGYTLLLQGTSHLDEAFELIQAAYQIDSENAAINDSLGWAYYKRGDAQAALPYLQYAFENYPDIEVAAHLVEVLWNLDKRSEAQKILKEAESLKGNRQILTDTLKRLGIRAPAGKSK